jgi:hypothetical protein
MASEVQQTQVFEIDQAQGCENSLEPVEGKWQKHHFLHRPIDGPIVFGRGAGHIMDCFLRLESEKFDSGGWFNRDGGFWKEEWGGGAPRNIGDGGQTIQKRKMADSSRWRWKYAKVRRGVEPLTIKYSR